MLIKDTLQINVHHATTAPVRDCKFSKYPTLLQSAVGMTHVLWSRLVMDYAASYFPLIVLGYHFLHLVSYN